MQDCKRHTVRHSRAYVPYIYVFKMIFVCFFCLHTKVSVTLLISMASGTVVYHNYSEYIQSTISVWFLGYRGPWACIRFLHVMWWCSVWDTTNCPFPTMTNIQHKDTLQIHCDSLGLLWTKVAKSVQSLRPNKPRSEMANDRTGCTYLDVTKDWSGHTSTFISAHRHFIGGQSIHPVTRCIYGLWLG